MPKRESLSSSISAAAIWGLWTADATAVTNAVNALTLGNGNDTPESDYEGLYQALTGAGRDLPLQRLVGDGIARADQGELHGRGHVCVRHGERWFPRLHRHTDGSLLLYTEYTYPDQIAAAILLVAIVAAVVLTYRGRKDSKKQDISDQVAVKASDRLRIVKMDAVKSQPAPAPEAGEGAPQ